MKENQETQKESKGSVDNVRRALIEFSEANHDGIIFSFVSGKPEPNGNNGIFVSGKPKDISIMLAFVLSKEPKIAEVVRIAVKLLNEYEKSKSKQKKKTLKINHLIKKQRIWNTY